MDIERGTHNRGRGGRGGGSISTSPRGQRLPKEAPCNVCVVAIDCLLRRRPVELLAVRLCGEYLAVLAPGHAMWQVCRVAIIVTFSVRTTMGAGD